MIWGGVIFLRTFVAYSATKALCVMISTMYTNRCITLTSGG